MRKLFMKQKKEQPKRATTVTKSQMGPYKQQPLKFYIGNGNNGQLIRRVLSTRPQWHQVTDTKEIFINLRWQQSNKNFKYENCIDNRIFKHCLNHFQHLYELSNKEYLFKNIVEYCQNHKINAFQFIPLTFILNIIDSNYQAQQAMFLHFYNEHNPIKNNSDINSIHLKRRKSNPHHQIQRKLKTYYCKYQIKSSYQVDNSPYLWILKPTFYNRGAGVHVFHNLLDMQTLMNKYIHGYAPSSSSNIQNSKGSTEVVLKRSFRIRQYANQFIIRSSSFVVQKYMQNPLLIAGRKFDIRMWILYTHQMKVYLFKQGYIRTSSYQYNLSEDKVSDPNIHLTNNAIQKNNEDYGRFQSGNQLSFKYLKDLLAQKDKNYDDLMIKIRQIIKITGLCVKKKLNKQQRNYCFEIYGYDFMLDYECNPWLIEVNTNPCLQESSPLLQELIPRMIDNAFQLTIDQIYDYKKKNNSSFHVEGQYNHENLWNFVVDLKKN